MRILTYSGSICYAKKSMDMINKAICLWVPVFFIAFGVVCLNSRWFQKLLQWQNELRGVKTEITPKTIKFAKYTGILCIILGIVFFTIFTFLSLSF